MMPATMSEQAESRRATVAEAATRLGLSVDTVRAMIREGSLKADRVQRGRGWSYMIELDAVPTADAPVVATDVTLPDPPVVAADPGMLVAFSRAIAPFVAQLVDQAETIGRLRAEAAFRRTERRPAARRPVRRVRSDPVTAS